MGLEMTKDTMCATVRLMMDLCHNSEHMESTTMALNRSSR